MELCGRSGDWTSRAICRQQKLTANLVLVSYGGNWTPLNEGWVVSKLHSTEALRGILKQRDKNINQDMQLCQLKI